MLHSLTNFHSLSALMMTVVVQAMTPPCLFSPLPHADERGPFFVLTQCSNSNEATTARRSKLHNVFQFHAGRLLPLRLLRNDGF